MSLDGLRDAYSREKKNEIANCELSRKRKLRELYNYTALLNASRPPQLQDWVISDEPGENERRFLDENDITEGRHFHDSTLPFPFQHASLPPAFPFQTPAKAPLPAFSKSSPSPAVAGPISLENQSRAASASPSVATQPLPSVETLTSNDASPVAQTPSVGARVEIPSQPDLHVATHSVEETGAIKPAIEEQQPIRTRSPELSKSKEEDIQTESTPDGPPVNSIEVAPLSTEAAATVSEALLPAKDAGGRKAPQVVHLPSQEVQEKRLRETERNLEVLQKDQKEDEKLGLPIAPAATTELASSPSSTVGPYSQATPRPQHHSPDTSPDTESFQPEESQNVQPGLGPDPVTQNSKEDYDGDLQLKIQETSEKTRAETPGTLDVQLQSENEEAIRLARDGKGRMKEPQPAPGPVLLTEHAEDVACSVQIGESVQDKNSHAPAVDSLPTPTMTAPEPSNIGSRNTDDLTAMPQESTPIGPGHRTPPADIEMDDAPAPLQEHGQAAPPSARPERMTTRVSPGAIRQKSDSEIIGKTPVPKSVLTPHSSNLSASASPTWPRSRDSKTKEVTTVIFAKQNTNRTSKTLQLYSEDYASLQGASLDSNRDYLEGLFKYQAHHPPRSIPLQELLASARKTVSTAGTLATIRECQDYKILKRVYQLQNANRWSLRQLQKSAEPPRPTTHLDHLLAEMKWMQTDFKEERKWKEALATTFAEWCAEYVNSSPDVRASLRVRVHIPKQSRRTSARDEDMHDAAAPDLIASGTNETESDSFADVDELPSIYGSNPPASLFTLGFNDVVMKMDRTPSSDAMLRELPTYGPPFHDVSPTSFCDPPILPISKFVTGKLISKVKGPPRKRSRYEYESEDEPSSPPSRSGTSAEHSMPSTPGRRLFHRNDLPPEMNEVALFNPENKHVRDRLQAAHQFRPPTEFPMPPVSFFENRTSSQWLWDEDQKLRSLVKEYTFNWSLVAQELSLPSMFVSGSGRRTPWECFERWVQLEGLPAEMSKTQYFRTYQTRLEQAQRTLTAQHQAQQQMLQQHAQQGQNIPGQLRRRTTQPIRVERRRENRHLAIIDGMRKLARKRESVAHKQAEAQKAAALRKAHEPAPPKSNVHTPQEFSRLKWEREEKIREKQHTMNMQRQQAMAAAAAAQRQAGMPGQPGMPNNVNQPQRTGIPNSNANVLTPLANSTSQAGQMASNTGIHTPSHPAQQSMRGGTFPNGNISGMTMGAPGIPQSQMQASMQNAQRMAPPDNVRLAMQRGQYPSSNQQHQFQLQQQQINMASNLTGGMSMGNGMPNPNIMASMAGQNLNGNMSASINGLAGNAGSPRMGQVNPSMQNPARPLSSGHMPQLHHIQNQLKAQHPEWSQEQVQKAASEHLAKLIQRSRAQAMNSAAGQSAIGGSPQIGSNVYLQNSGIANSPSPNAVQNYQTQLLQQQRMINQQRSQQAGSPSMNSARPSSRSATPQNTQLQQSPGMQQAQLARN
ncbi:hypothetical protein K469DRAFT_642642 [Zopfia rhizophila CBS 207.26]|uniref:Vacuolar import and degradation protein 21 n=1 Tax=Zopfia rhizophila CBS 207.26 TaxID=1314779 RepID=A0A6A6DM02_9PEZI|nr:hypothetical protein K469DRAFT_642642 [Zopfia rhizophila CBS 207.26]